MILTEAYQSHPDSFEKARPDRVSFMPKKYREHFALGSTTYPISAVRTLDKTRYYNPGTLKPGVSTTINPAQFGGTTCPSDFPATVYRLFRGQDATCTINDSTVYTLDTSTTTCFQDKDGNWKRRYNRKPTTAIDTLDGTATGVTKVASTYDGTKCSDLVAANPTAYPATKLLTTATPICPAVPALCTLTDAALYTIDKGMGTCSNVNAAGALYDTAGRYYRPFGLRTDLETVTTTPALYGGSTCTQQVQSNSTAYPSQKIRDIALGVNSVSYCAPVNASCITEPAQVYTIQPLTSTGSQDYSACIQNTTDKLWYRPLRKRTDAETLTQTGKTALYGGLTCSQQIAPTSTSFPAQRVVGSGTTAPSYCPPIPARCQDAVADNFDTNYTFLDPTLGSTFIPVDCSFTVDTANFTCSATNNDKIIPLLNPIASANGGLSCPSFASNIGYPGTTIQYLSDGKTPSTMTIPDGCYVDTSSLNLNFSGMGI